MLNSKFINNLINAVTLRREYIIFNRVAIFILLYLGTKVLWVGIYGGLFHLHALILVLITWVLFSNIMAQPINHYNPFVQKFCAQNGLFLAEGPGYAKAYITDGFHLFMFICMVTLMLQIYIALFYSVSFISIEDHFYYFATVIQLKVYSHEDSYQATILKENKGKSGVYR
jgi:hypothetical protein